MVEVVARIKISGKNFETMVNLDKALEFKNGKRSIDDTMIVDRVFYDIKKGLQVSDEDLMKAFKTTDMGEIITKIIKKGEVQKPVEYVRKKQEDKVKQVIDFLAKNAVDPKGVPYSADRIKTAMQEAGVNVGDKPIEEQINPIVKKLQPIIPIKIETKKIKIKVPAIHTGQVYGLLKEYKEKEEWLEDGSLLCVVNIPLGLQLQFYDKLNSITHGGAITEEVKEK